MRRVLFVFSRVLTETTARAVHRPPVGLPAPSLTGRVWSLPGQQAIGSGGRPNPAQKGMNGARPTDVLKFVFENILKVLGLETQIIHGLATGGMVENGHQPTQVRTKGRKLVVAPGLAKGISSVIASQSDVFAP